MRLSKRQLRNLLRYGEVRFGNDELFSVTSIAEQTGKEILKVYNSMAIKRIIEIIQRNPEYRFTKFAGCFRKAMDKLSEANYWFERVKENAKQGK